VKENTMAGKKEMYYLTKKKTSRSPKRKTKGLKKGKSERNGKATMRLGKKKKGGGVFLQVGKQSKVKE